MEGETDLILDDISFLKFTPEIKQQIEKLSEVDSMSLNNCGLSTLKNFPNCTNLRQLELGENDFPSSELVYI